MIKELLKDKNYLFVLLSFLIVAIFLRTYNFSNRLIYGPEQARSFLTASLNVIEKPSLLGQEYFRFTSQGHKLFYSATFTYSLIPLLLIFNNNILPISFFFALLNIFTGLCVFYVGYKLSNKYIALLSSSIFLFNSYMIYHSLFLWPYNYLPLFGILSVYLIYLIKSGQKTINVFWLGLISGLGFGIQYLYAPYIIIFFSILIYVSKERFKHILFFFVGLIVGDLPMILFDLKHNFYNLSTSIHFLIDTLLHKSDASFNYYYLLPLWGIGALLVGFLLFKLYKKSKYIAIGLLIIYFLININSSHVNLNKSLGMPDGLIWSDYFQVAKVIARDKPVNFNVATLLDFDTRAYVLRFPLQSIYHLNPMGVEDYPNAKNLYVFAKTDYDINHPKVWELQSFSPYNVKVLENVKGSYVLYKLSKK